MTQIRLCRVKFLKSRQSLATRWKKWNCTFTVDPYAMTTEEIETFSEDEFLDVSSSDDEELCPVNITMTPDTPQF